MKTDHLIGNSEHRPLSSHPGRGESALNNATPATLISHFPRGRGAFPFLLLLLSVLCFALIHQLWVSEMPAPVVSRQSLLITPRVTGRLPRSGNLLPGFSPSSSISRRRDLTPPAVKIQSRRTYQRPLDLIWQEVPAWMASFVQAPGLFPHPGLQLSPSINSFIPPPLG